MTAESLGERLHLTGFTELLDSLTADFDSTGLPANAADLAHLLFHNIGLGGEA